MKRTILTAALLMAATTANAETRANYEGQWRLQAADRVDSDGRKYDHYVYLEGMRWFSRAVYEDQSQDTFFADVQCNDGGALVYEDGTTGRPFRELPPGSIGRTMITVACGW